MRTWERVVYACLCGQCGAALGVGMSRLVIQLPNLKRQLVRCENCAGPVPPDLPPPGPTQRRTKQMTPIRPLALKLKAEWTPYKDA